MPECEKATCQDQADVVARFPKNEVQRVYCMEHFRELRQIDFMNVEEHRRL